MAQVDVVHVIAAGDTARHWDGSGFSIGVNDAFKWGHRLNYLVVVNHPSKFKNEPERLSNIINAHPEKFFSHTTAWRQWYPMMTPIKLRSFWGRANRKHIYHSETSPFVAMSLAFHLGATDIILWGVDFVNHSIFREGSKKQQREVENYQAFIKSLEAQGTKVWCGDEGSALNLSIWNKQTL